VISAISAIVGGMIAGVKLPLFSPILYIMSKFSKRLFLVSFGVYTILLGYEYELMSIYSSDPVFLMALTIPTLLLLDSGLKNNLNFCRRHMILAGMIILGLLIHEIFVVAVVMALIDNFSEDRSKRGSLIIIFGISVLIFGLYLSRSVLDVLGGSASQVVFISSITVFTALLFWRNIGTVEF